MPMMDDSIATEGHGDVEDLVAEYPDGFPGQRLLVLPRQAVLAARRFPLTSQLFVTDCGHFPRARGHLRRRAGEETTSTILMVCTDGEGWVAIGDERFTLSRGQAVVIEQGKDHSYGADRNHPWTLWWVHTEGPAVAEFARVLRAGGAFPVFAVADVDHVVQLIDEIIEHMSRSDSPREQVMVASIAWHLWGSLLALQQRSDSTVDAVHLAQRLIEARVGQAIRVEDIARGVSLSSSHLSAVFRRHTGMSVMEYHTRLRMVKARRLLDSTTLPLGQIAKTLGYDDPLYFSRRFRAIHGMSPSEYRRSQKG